MLKLCAAILAVTLAGCGTQNNLGAHVAPNAPHLEAPACGESDEARPLVVEQDSAARARIESLAKHGPIVARYSKCELRILPQCSVQGGYRWVPVELKHERKTISNSDELHASLPLGAAKLESTLRSSGELVADMTLAGRWESDRPLVRQDELQGDCAGATHVVTALNAGAFALRTATAGDVQGGGSVLGASASGASSSSTTVLNEDGDASKCATQSEAGPPPGCSALLRLEMTSVRAGVACPPLRAWNGNTCAVVPRACPKGQQQVPDGACVGSGTRYAVTTSCLTGSDDVCEKECDAGDAESCAEVGFRSVGKDAHRAVTFASRGCEKGSARGCNNLATAYLGGRGGLPSDPQRGIELLTSACDHDFALACANLAENFFVGTKVPRDEARALTAADKACALGNVHACAIAANVQRKTSPEVAAPRLEQTCRMGEPTACAVYAYMLEAGQGIPRDARAAIPYYERACNLGSVPGCANLALELGIGKSVARDLDRALDLASRTCTARDNFGCYVLGRFQAESATDPAVRQKGIEGVTRACSNGTKAACAYLDARKKPAKK